MPRLSIFILLFSAIFLSACHSEAPTTDVDKAAGQFFQRMQEAKFDLIYDDAAAKFKEQNSRAALLESLHTLGEMGRVGFWSRISMTVEQEGKFRVIKPVYNIRTEHQLGEVTLKFLDEDGEWKFMGILLRQRG